MCPGAVRSTYIASLAVYNRAATRQLQTSRPVDCCAALLCMNISHSLSAGKTVPWCYFIWYLVTVATPFDHSPATWLNSLGIGAFVGAVLLFSVGSRKGQRVDLWLTMRLFLIPFCVLSFSSLIEGHGYFLIVPPHFPKQVTSVGLYLVFDLFAAVLERLGRKDCVTNPALPHTYSVEGAITHLADLRQSFRIKKSLSIVLDKPISVSDQECVKVSQASIPIGRLRTDGGEYLKSCSYVTCNCLLSLSKSQVSSLPATARPSASLDPSRGAGSTNQQRLFLGEGA